MAAMFQPHQIVVVVSQKQKQRTNGSYVCALSCIESGVKGGGNLYTLYARLVA